MRLITRAILGKVASDYKKTRSSQELNEAMGQVKRASRTGEITVFLSHKHDNSEELKHAIALFQSLGISVYVDWQDQAMPPITSGTTATLIKKKIRTNKKFVLLATEEAIASKWCNWELGFGDAHKYSDDIAILPIAENDGRWRGNEYLQIYPYIEIDQDPETSGYYVVHKTWRLSLADWLRR